MAGAAALVVGTELIVVRRLFNASRVVLFIATVGVAQLIALVIVVVLPNVVRRHPGGVRAPWAEIEVTDSLGSGAGRRRCSS